MTHTIGIEWVAAVGGAWLTLAFVDDWQTSDTQVGCLQVSGRQMSTFAES